MLGVSGAGDYQPSLKTSAYTVQIALWNILIISLCTWSLPLQSMLKHGLVIWGFWWLGTGIISIQLLENSTVDPLVVPRPWEVFSCKATSNLIVEHSVFLSPQTRLELWFWPLIQIGKRLSVVGGRPASVHYRLNYVGAFRCCRGRHFRATFWGWETARSPCVSQVQGNLSSDKLPGAKGSELKPSVRAWVSIWLRKPAKQKTADGRKTPQERPLDVLFQANKSKT